MLDPNRPVEQVPLPPASCPIFRGTIPHPICSTLTRPLAPLKLCLEYSAPAFLLYLFLLILQAFFLRGWCLSWGLNHFPDWIKWCCSLSHGSVGFLPISKFTAHNRTFIVQLFDHLRPPLAWRLQEAGRCLRTPLGIPTSSTEPAPRWGSVGCLLQEQTDTHAGPSLEEAAGCSLPHPPQPLLHRDSLTGWWTHCSSSWGGSQSSAPRRRAGWCGHRGPTRCGWLPGTWRRSCPGSCAYTAAGVWAG